MTKSITAILAFLGLIIFNFGCTTNEKALAAILAETSEIGRVNVESNNQWLGTQKLEVENLRLTRHGSGQERKEKIQAAVNNAPVAPSDSVTNPFPQPPSKF